MPYEGLEDGLYLLKQRSQAKGLDHYGILDIGNRLRNAYAPYPIVVHQTPPAIRADWLQNTGSWVAVAKITDEAGAIRRIRTALSNPHYDLFGHNCEHFARFVATGRRESTQLQTGFIVAGVLTLLFLASGKRAA